jgi:streptomycin 6-kinase
MARRSSRRRVFCCRHRGANILRNPDVAAALALGRFDRQVDRLTDTAAVDRKRLLKWTLPFAGLSAAWHVADREPADLDFEVAGLAAAALGA